MGHVCQEQIHKDARQGNGKISRRSQARRLGRVGISWAYRDNPHLAIILADVGRVLGDASTSPSQHANLTIFHINHIPFPSTVPGSQCLILVYISILTSCTSCRFSSITNLCLRINYNSGYSMVTSKSLPRPHASPHHRALVLSLNAKWGPHFKCILTISTIRNLVGPHIIYII